jgi:hypothetical protein
LAKYIINKSVLNNTAVSLFTLAMEITTTSETIIMTMMMMMMMIIMMMMVVVVVEEKYQCISIFLLKFGETQDVLLLTAAGI